MDDRKISDINVNNGTNLYKETKKYKYSLLDNGLPPNNIKRKSSSSDNITCLSILKQIFQRSRSNNINTDCRTSTVTY
jgi:hypothetical protein